MGLLLAFAPFIAFALLNHLAGAATGLTAGAAVAAALLLRDWMTPGRTAKVLEIGTVLLFGGLALYAFAGGPAWSIVRVRLWVDAGLLLIVLVSMAIRQPFTIQYARERVARTLWDNPVFVRTNYIITGVWAVAFAVMVIADVSLLRIPAVPASISIVATVLALVGAIQFTGWYPRRVRAGVARP
ncbi:MAG TPA: hypothetical protein VIG49_03675 [Acetobacteraceae bacterium]|jgi:hypothetical protein